MLFRNRRRYLFGCVHLVDVVLETLLAPPDVAMAVVKALLALELLPPHMDQGYVLSYFISVRGDVLAVLAWMKLVLVVFGRGVFGQGVVHHLAFALILICLGHGRRRWGKRLGIKLLRWSRFDRFFAICDIVTSRIAQTLSGFLFVLQPFGDVRNGSSH